MKIFICLILIFSNLITFGQKENTKQLSFNFYEIHVFTGLTKNGTHILKLKENGLIMRKFSFYGFSNEKNKIINFKELSGNDLKEIKINYKALLKFLKNFNYKTYQPMKEKKESMIINGDTLVKEHIISPHDLGTRILFIDNNYESFFIRYYFCDDQLDEFIEKINKMIPKKFREDYEFQKRCN